VHDCVSSTKLRSQPQLSAVDFLEGGNGSRGTNPKTARKLSEEKDFVCVDIPFFKAPSNPGAPDTSRFISDADCRIMWPLYKIMLSRLELIVPNLDSKHYFLGGFSNGGHVAAGLIDQSDGEAVRKFSAFFSSMEADAFIIMIFSRENLCFCSTASKDNRAERVQEILNAFRTAEVKIAVHPMKGSAMRFLIPRCPLCATAS